MYVALTTYVHSRFWQKVTDKPSQDLAGYAHDNNSHMSGLHAHERAASTQHAAQEERRSDPLEMAATILPPQNRRCLEPLSPPPSAVAVHQAPGQNAWTLFEKCAWSGNVRK